MRQLKTIAVTALLALTVAGCGGGGSGYVDAKEAEKRLDRLMSAVQMIAVNSDHMVSLNRGAARNRQGLEFFNYLLEREILSQSEKKNFYVTSEEAGKGGGKTITEVAFATPKLGKLMKVLSRQGAKTVVVFCLNAKHWNAFGELGVLLSFSEPVNGRFAAFLTADVAEGEYGITADEWADPAGKLFGKKAPFQFVGE